MPTIPAQDLSLHDVKEKFGLQAINDEQFFQEWNNNLPELNNLETQALDRVTANFLHLDEYPILEVIVKMVVFSPLLDLAGFYQPPFRVIAEESVKVTAEDEGEIIQGRIDILVLHNQFWALVIESKKAQFFLKLAIPQALTYMMANPDSQKPGFGLVTNGSEFIFLKVVKHNIPKYALSPLFSLRRSQEDLYTVLRVLKNMANLINN